MSTTTSYRTGLSPLAAGLTVVAAVALIVSMVGPTWMALFGRFDVSFPRLRSLTSLDSAPGVQHLYFGWLAWVLTILVLAALVATVVLPTSLITQGTQAAAVVLGLAGLVLTAFCLVQLSNQDPTGGLLAHLGWLRFGGYLHLLGWVLAIVAAIYAPRATAAPQA